MLSQLIIPERIKVGFQQREGTYTGKLAYVIYFDHAGKLRKETSWSSWRDKQLEPEEFVNEPTDGFVLNKKVGGVRDSYSWDARQEYVRVYDPRNFEFEITIPNLLFILRECDCSRGKGLEGKFVYAWDRTTLVLLPVIAQEYKDSKKFTGLQSQKIKARELIPGASYCTKKQVPLIYLGKFDYYYQADTDYETKRTEETLLIKRYVFWNQTEFVFMDSMNSLAALITPDPVSNFAELIESYHQSPHGSQPVELFLKQEPDDPTDYYNYWCVEQSPGSYCLYRTYMDYRGSSHNHIECYGVVSLIDGKIQKQYRGGVAYSPNYQGYKHTYGQTIPWVKPTNQRLWIRLASGAVYPYNQTNFRKDRNG